VFLFEPDQTPYDLRWRMFGIPVRVHPLFWLVSALLGWNALERGVGYLALWIGCVFVSILVHELGHVLMGRVFGTHGHIVLYSFGGLAIGSNDLRGRWRRIAVLAAGPGAGFLLLGVLALVMQLTYPNRLPAYLDLLRAQLGMAPHGDILLLAFQPMPMDVVVEDLIWINLFWGMLNLLPIWPLDGGQITRESLEGALRERGTTLALGISGCVSGLLAIHVLLATTSKGEMRLIPHLPAFGGMFTALFFAMLCVGSFQALQAENARRRFWDDRMPWER
jgi:Zn-dependent protease